MMTRQTGLYTNLYMNNETHKKCHREEDLNTHLSLNLWIIIIILFVFRMEYRNRERIKKEPKQEQGEPRKEIGKLMEEIDKLRKTNGELMEENEKLQKEIDQRRAQFRNDWKKEFFQAVNVILDPATAHPALILSENNKCVTFGEKSQDLPKDPQRFHSLPCVLGHSVFTSGRFYWEVDVRNSGAWDLGICRQNVMRQGRICVKPEDGYWAIRFYNGEYWALTSPEMQLTIKEHPTRVCIFLECDDGLISFYNMTDKSHIHTFSQGSFNGSLQPFFRLWLGYSKSLTICPVPNA
ncbi:butyrophilin subfamily 1 member A1-like isoform X3 [Suricata suricatta]|uniref:butyrophilin subfamily 1 member A1-like isoform X3 n=1 Tax=Suricata suricatta TaxID=37032 RepID=UPI001155670B|nr:butyrophilin subfamily 1 member A1-like isoform X3 [Suricata suricatta]